MGLEFAQKSGGFVVNVMVRETVDAIGCLRQNVEALAWFIPKLSVVVFENDLVDGSREAFVQWSKNAQGYVVNLMQCEEATDCKFGETHQYEEGFESTDYFKKSAVAAWLDSVNTWQITSCLHQPTSTTLKGSSWIWIWAFPYRHCEFYTVLERLQRMSLQIPEERCGRGQRTPSLLHTISPPFGLL